MTDTQLSDELLDTFRQTLVQARRIYLEAGQQIVHHHPQLIAGQVDRYVAVMDDLHKGLLIKVYVTISEADRRWSPGERRLAQELLLHTWGRWLEGDDLRQAAIEVHQQSAGLSWYSLVRPFARFQPLRDFVQPLEAVCLKMANVVAKVDGRIGPEEQQRLFDLQAELDRHLHAIPLDDGPHVAQPIRTAPYNLSPDSADPPIVTAELADRAPTPLGDSRRGTSTRGERLPGDRGRPSHGRPTSRDSARQGGAAAASSIANGSESATAPRPTLEEVLAQLDKLIGMQPVKQEVRSLTNYLRLQQHREQAGLPQAPLSLHMVFTGNPGTGKTTVARIVGQILGALGVLPQGHVVETDRSGLVAEYAGQTGPKTNRKIDEALGGVLFIDEAYSLISAHGDDAYGAEAVQALLKRMEDDRHQLVVILAGYPEPIERLLTSNPGLQSRFNRRIHFDDYRPLELAQIFGVICDQHHYVTLPETRARLLLGLDWLFRNRDEHFGNGRLVRNLFEDAIRALADRVVVAPSATRDLLTQLLPADLNFPQVPSSELPGTLAEQLFKVRCPGCQHASRVRTHFLGQAVRCKHCDAKFRAEWGEPAR